MAVAVLGFHITDRCQLDCCHCLRDPEQKPKDLDPAVIERVLSQAKRIYRSAQIALTGGEPTLHPEFERIVDSIATLGFGWHMVTNGRRFPDVIRRLRERPARIEALTAVNFSLDGTDEATHDAIRGEGSYRDVMTGATLCTAMGIPFVLQMVLHAKNQHQLESMGLLASQLGAKHVSFSMLQATGTLHDTELYLSPRAWRSIGDRIDRLRAALTIPIVTPEGFYREQPFHTCEPFASTQLHVDVDGHLNLCCQHSGVPGSRSDVVADLRDVSLPDAHGRLLDLIHRTQRDKIATIERGGLDEWDHFPCNSCMKYFGKPHWDDRGAAGPTALRPRWRGAWAPEGQRARLPIVR